MLSDLHARTERGSRDVPRLQQHLHPAAVAPVRLQQLEHPFVGPARLARERPTHDVRQMEVAHRDRVGVTERRARDLGRRPRSHAADREEPGVRLIQRE